MSFPFNINTNLTHHSLFLKGLWHAFSVTYIPGHAPSHLPYIRFLSHTPHSLQSSRGSRAVRRVTIHRRACCEGNTVLCLQGVWFPAVGEGRELELSSKDRHGQRFAHKHQSGQPRCHSVWALVGRPPENHAASSSSSSPAEKSSCSWLICSVFSRGLV